MLRRHLLQLIFLAISVSLLLTCTTTQQLPVSDKVAVSSRPLASDPAGQPKEAHILSGKVIGIVDGDTIDVLDDETETHRVRLAGIDAPEKRQPYSDKARQSLAVMTSGTHVLVEWSKLDGFQRIVGKVRQNGRDICLEQIRAGFAWHFKKYQSEQSDEDRVLYDEEEKKARIAKNGLWQDPRPTEPWVFRDRNRQHPSLPSPTRESGQARGSESLSPNSFRGNKRSMIYHWPGCPNYDDIAPHNRVFFQSREEAERAGYRPARNCSY